MFSSIEGCRLHFMPFNSININNNYMKIKTVTLTLVLAQTDYRMYERDIRNRGYMSYSILKEVSAIR